MGHTKFGQSGIELLFVMGIMTTIFVIIMLISYQAQMDTAALSADFEAHRICYELAFRISTVDAAGNGTSASLGLPEKIAGSNYTVFFSGASRRISILHANGVAGCPLPTSSIANGTGAGAAGNFYIHGDMPLRNIGQGVVIG
jgi:hypothetical protein